MTAFNKLKDLEKFLNNKIKDALKNEVSNKVKEIQSDNVDIYVYKAYSPSSPDNEPWIYDRRMDNGGLSDEKNMISKVKQTKNGVTLTTENITTGSDSDIKIAGLIEHGHNNGYGDYDYLENRDDTAYQYLKPRSFIEETRKDLRNGEALIALKKGLQRQGIKTE